MRKCMEQDKYVLEYGFSFPLMIFLCLCVFVSPWNSSRETNRRHSHIQIFIYGQWSLMPPPIAENFLIRTNTVYWLTESIFIFHIHFLRARHLVLPRFINSKILLWNFVLRVLFQGSFRWPKNHIEMMAAGKNAFSVNFVLNFGG